MIDAHIHIERGPYTMDWICEFVEQATQNNIQEIWLLEHCYRFKEFVYMYKTVCDYSNYISNWFNKKAGTLMLGDYLNFVNMVRKKQWPVNIKFGLEVCYFKEHEADVKQLTYDKELDFLVGSVHFIDNFAFDHKYEHWENRDIDSTYRRYFETAIDLANSSIYDGIAHPDCIKLFGHRPSFSLVDYYEKLALALKHKNMYAEQSTGINRRTGAEIGMNKTMLAIMKKHAVKIMTASDAHCPDDVGLNIMQATALL